MKSSCCSKCIYAKFTDNNLCCIKCPPVPHPQTHLARWPIVKPGQFCGCFHPADSLRSFEQIIDNLPVEHDSLGPFCTIPLSQGRFAKVDPEDYIWLSQFRWHCKNNINAVYAVRTITQNGKSKRIYMHRLIANTPAHLFCDHINHDGLDNRKKNLRNCTLRQNNANSRSSASSSSKYKGVSWSKAKSRWSAYIKKDGKQFFLGYFHSETEAARAYDRKAKEFFGRFANLNFPTNI